MAEAAKARPASTILLLRDSAGPDGKGEIEVFMMVRHYEIDFNSGALVFPGGAVDPGDHDIAGKPELYLGGNGLDAQALGFRIAAIRETFEESGILLAKPRGSNDLVSAARAAEISAAFRAAPDEGNLFEKIFSNNGNLLTLDELVPYAHWITPEGMPKRFDTWFFLAAAPPDQVGAHDGKEFDGFHLGFAARGAGGRRKRPLQAAVSDHAQFDQARQASHGESRARRCPRQAGRHRDAGHDKREWRPPAAHPGRGRLRRRGVRGRQFGLTRPNTSTSDE